MTAAAGLAAYAEAHLAAFREDLRALVGQDSGTRDVDGVNAVADWVQARMETNGFSVRRAPLTDGFGDLVDARLTGSGRVRVLLLAHMDTVFPAGTAAERPYEERDGRAYGPGVSDMKGGLLTGVYAVEALGAAQLLSRFGELRYLFTPDEEIGAPASKAVLAEAARAADVCLVLEAARESGAVVSSRKGCTIARLTFTGRAAHAGVEPERGRNALVAAAHAILAVAELNDPAFGDTATAGVCLAGTQANVVPAECRLEVDLRATSEVRLRRLEDAVRRIADHHAIDGVTTTLELDFWRRPMERGDGTARLASTAIALADHHLGFTLTEEATGGGSDACEAAGAGTATLDGLGPVGGDDHGPSEWLELGSIAPRVALLALLMLALTGGEESEPW
jgi:glutamate carboxypeptidase